MDSTSSTNENKCTCVPSGRCHAHTLLGCPHPHCFDVNGVWKCVVPPNKRSCLKDGVRTGQTNNENHVAGSCPRTMRS